MSNIVCVECKSQVSTGSDQCPECGYLFESAEPIRCPECSRMVVFAGGVCPECGFPYEALDELVKQSAVAGQEQPGEVGASESPRLVAPGQAASLLSAVHPVEAVRPTAPSADVAAPPTGFPEAQVASLNELLAGISAFLEDSKKSNTLLSDVAAGVERFLANAEQLKVDLTSVMTEQHQGNLNELREVSSNFSQEMRSAVEGIASAKASAVAEILSAAEKAKVEGGDDPSAAPDKVSGTVDYIFYICLAMFFFAALNIAVTAYVVKLVK